MSRKERMKIYHGIPTPSYVNKGESVHIDFSNEFYGKGVRTVVDRKASTGGNKTSLTITDGISGMSAKFTKAIESVYDHCVILNEEFDFKDEVSISAIIKTKDIQAYFSGLYLMRVVDPSQNLVTPNADTVYRVLGLDKVANSPKDKLSLCAYNNNVTVPGKVIIVDVPTDTYMHYQFVCKNMITYIYINGELISTQDMSDFGMTLTKFNCIRFLFPVDIGGELCVENLVVSRNTNIYPNRIPEDYLQGKAIIKERLGQQQIKGDPLISQTTELIVDSSGKLPKPYSNEVNADGTYTHLYKPELSVLNANVWNSTSKLKIKGLNNEIISGVIDSDTALCKVTAYKDILTVTVDDVSKISVGDKLYVYYPYTNEVDNIGIRVVESVDISTKTVKVTSNYGFNIDTTKGDCYLVEITETSSSPIVKTTDGTVVNGTWTGLGTSQATFTLDSNTGLSGKDLVVTYSLNMPQGNSHFPELPSDIERAYTETGIEMKPVSEIVIEDDFKGKTIGDTSICPHICKNLAYGYLIDPTHPILESNELTNYSYLAKLDGVPLKTTTDIEDSIPQQIFEFDLIKLVESKIGEIPSSDKLSWLKSNYQSVYITYTGYSTSSSANNTMITLFNHIQNKWMDTWKVIPGATTPTTTTGDFGGDTNFANLIPQGKLYVLAYTYKSNGTIPSVVNTDYIKVDVRLKTDTTFTTLYCDNKRAREDKCNPVLIQKETKTVKRYIPSKECFVTEYSYVTLPVFNDLPTYVNNGKKVSSHGKYYLSSLGTGKIHNKYPGENLGQLLNKKQLYKYSGDNILEVPYTMFIDKGAMNDYRNFFTQLELVSDPNVPVIQGLLATKTTDGYLSGHGKSRGISSIPKLVNNPSEYYGLALTLYEYNKEICMLVTTCSPEFDVNVYNSTPGLSHLYKLPNRPLIK